MPPGAGLRTAVWAVFFCLTTLRGIVTFTSANNFSDLNRNKADFSAIYVQPDPRAYFQVLGGLDYIIPHLAQPIISQIVDARRRSKKGPVTVLDLGCSYGLNGALLKYGLSLDMLRERYTSPAIQKVGVEEFLKLDRSFMASWPVREGVRVIGLDSSAPAIEYAQRVGCIDYGIAANLETGELSREAAAELSKVDLIVSTGCVGYVTRKTFDKLSVCKTNGEAPWVVSFVLRMFDYQDIMQTLGRQGLITEKLEGATFVQRRFRDENEMEATLRELETRGIDPTGKEAEGLFHADLFVSRPPAEVEACPVHRLVSITSGANRRYGRRVRLQRSGAPHAGERPLRVVR